jgi:hypothetical protein
MPPRNEPPYVPIRTNSWPVRHTPRWLMGVGVALVAGAVLVGLAHKPSTAQRASDMHGFLTEVNTDMESCSGGIGESLKALHLVQAGQDTAKDVNDAVSLAQQAGSNCSPANNESIDDLENYQVPESLDSYHLIGVVTGLINWAAPDAQNVMVDVTKVLQARTPTAKASAEAALAQARNKLDKQGAYLDSVMEHAIKSLKMDAKPKPYLPR